MSLRFLIAVYALVGALPVLGKVADSRDAMASRPSTADTSILDQYRRDAVAGDAEAQYRLGFLYERGQSFPRDDRMADHWYRKAADQGHPGAQNVLGLRLHGRARDDTGRRAAIELIRKSAEQGFAMGQYNMGIMHQHGLGIPSDEFVALEWFSKAAAQGDAPSFFWIGRAHEKGIGRSASDAEAATWYRRGADRGDAAAQNALGILYATGRGGLSMSVADMLGWLGLAADQGYGLAMYNLARVYEKGVGVPIDYERAYVWFNLAVATGVGEAASSRSRIERLMTPAQIARAQQYSREWRPKRTLPAMEN